jgi:hypothetical protein
MLNKANLLDRDAVDNPDGTFYKGFAFNLEKGLFM